jgi:hypothetical protein
MGIFNDITAIQNIIYIVASILFISGIKDAWERRYRSER